MHHETETVAVGTVHGRNWSVTDDMLYAPGGDPANSTLSSPAMINTPLPSRQRGNMYAMHRESDIVAVGTVHGRNWAVTEDMLYAPGGDPANSTLSSPAMINEMEITATEMLDPHMPDGGFTVGFHVDVKHVAPAKPGAAIRTTAELLEVNGTKYTFHVEARDVEHDSLIGIGTHRRAALWPEPSP